jgi:hypothetical protein
VTARVSGALVSRYAAALKVTNSDGSQKLITKEYRKGLGI